MRILLFSSLTFKTPKKLIKFFFLDITFWRYIYIIFQRKKAKKKSQNSRNQGFSTYFCLMIEGSGSIPLTNGSGSRMPKNMWIRIRICNTGFSSSSKFEANFNSWILIHIWIRILSESATLVFTNIVPLFGPVICQALRLESMWINTIRLVSVLVFVQV